MSVNTAQKKSHLKRQSTKMAERVELELLVAGTEFADLERAVYKGTKNNTKAPKEKHVQRIIQTVMSERVSGTVFSRPYKHARIC